MVSLVQGLFEEDAAEGVLAILAAPKTGEAAASVLDMLAAYEQQELDLVSDNTCVSDFVGDECLAMLCAAEAHPSDLASVNEVFALDGPDLLVERHLLLALKGGPMRVVKLRDGISIDVPRHYGDYMMSKDKPHWNTRMAAEVERLLNIPVAKMIHVSEAPDDAEGPFELVWAFAVKPANELKVDGDAFRPRLCVGRVSKEGVETTTALDTFATSVNMITTKTHWALTSYDRWIDFEFDISQFHQSTTIGPDQKPILTKQPKGFAVRGPHGQPPEEMLWQLCVQMQGTKTASKAANAQLDRLLIEGGGFKRSLGDSRLFNLRHDEYGGVRLLMVSDDGNGAAEKQSGIDYTLELVRRIYKISAVGPWSSFKGFELECDRQSGAVRFRAKRLIDNGIAELFPGELLYKPVTPSSTTLAKLTIEDAPD